ncbi:MAG: hypothetical protein ACRCS6_01670 [Turicibacter sp.]
MVVIMSGKAKKCEKNNQWATQSKVGNLSDHKEKTEFSNEWASSSKISDECCCSKKEK